jgi:hypothetical protein
MSKIWQKPKRKGGCIPEFQSSEELWNAACEYFEWATENPLIEQKPMSIAGGLVMAEIEKMRVFTFSALCLHLDCSYTSYKRWRTEDRFAEACERIDAVIYTQKFEGAAAGLFNSNLIMSDLGLANKQQLEHSGSIETLTDDDLNKRIAELTKVKND